MLRGGGDIDGAHAADRCRNVDASALLVSMVPRVTLTPASSVTVMSLNADAILATSSSMAPMMAIVLMRSFLSIASRFSLGFAYFRFAHFQRRLPTACASSRSNASVICQLKHLSVMD